MEINFGFQPHAPTRNKFPFSILSLIHVSIVLIIDVFILYLNGDPRPFLRATNTTIINYGLWLLIEISLLLGEWANLCQNQNVVLNFFVSVFHFHRLRRKAILFLVHNIALYKYTWQLWSKCECIDRDLKLNFGIYIPYGLAAK